MGVWGAQLPSKVQGWPLWADYSSLQPIPFYKRFDRFSIIMPRWTAMVLEDPSEEVMFVMSPYSLNPQSGKTIGSKGPKIHCLQIVKMWFRAGRVRLKDAKQVVYKCSKSGRGKICDHLNTTFL